MKNSKFLPFLFLIFSVFILIYIFYKSEIIGEGLKREYYILHYIVATIFIILSIISFKLMDEINRLIFICCVSVFLGFYSFELYLFYKEKKNFLKIDTRINENKKIIYKSKLYNEKTGLNYDARSLIAIYKDKVGVGEKITLNIHPSNFIKNEVIDILPLSGQSNINTILCNENGYYQIFKSDRYGFNNPDNEWDKKEIEYVLIGDSFVHGACVNRPDDLASQIRKISKKSALSLGQNGNGPLLELATLKEYVPKKTNKILWFYYEDNDLANLFKELKSVKLINYLNDPNYSQNLIIKQNEVDKILSKFLKKEIGKSLDPNIELTDNFVKKEDKQKKQLKFNLKKFIKLYETRKIIFNPKYIIQPEFKEIILQAKNFSIKNKSKLYFVYLPDYHRYKSFFYRSEKNKIKKIILNMDIEFIDIDIEVFQKQQNPLSLFPFQMYGHYTPEGYQLIAHAIFKLTNND